MAFTFGGEFAVGKSPEEAYDFLTDPQRFSPLLPDYERVDVEDARNFTVKVKVGISHIRGTATVKMHLAEAERPRRALYTGKGTMAGGTVDLSAGFDLEPLDGQGTRIKWRGQAQIFGRLTSIAGGLLEPLARKNVQRVVESLQQALGGTPVSATRAS
jgi:carbon monoxide dehydrogenase subunit G